MPAYNAERYLEEAVRSVLNQTYTDFELIVTDDGSTDGTLDILRQFAQEDARLVIDSRPNTGYLVALNEMLARAQGEYIARMDADDIAMADRFERQVAYLDAHEDVVCLGTAVAIIDEKDRVFGECYTEGMTDDEVQRRLLAGRTSICHPTAMYRRDVVMQLGGYHPEYYAAEDLDLWLRLAEVGKLAVLPDILLHYRDHAGSVSTKQHDQQLANMRAACMAACTRRGVAVAFVNRGWRATTEYDAALQRGWAWAARRERWLTMGYAFKAIGLAPLKMGGWKLVCRALLGWWRPPSRRSVANDDDQ